MMDHQEISSAEAAARWQPLARNQRRVVGVLVEKAKTTPENYPLSLNTLVNGCNQKSNRFPQMQLDASDVEEALDRLRAMGATAQVEGDGRVDKHRHLLYDWLGVDKVELAVMAELLLRGAQTLGELRSRAARMESVPGISELRPVVESLRQKGLLIYLTPPGRGAVVTHALYEERELEKLRAEHGNERVEMPAPSTESISAPTSASASANPSPAPRTNEIDSLRAEVAEMKDLIEKVRVDLDELRAELGVEGG